MAVNGNTAFRFRVTLRLDGRECWREILVPASLTFFDLHAVLQECFMWYGEHLFCFCATFPKWEAGASGRIVGRRALIP